MSHLSDQFLQQFLEDIRGDKDIPDFLKEKLFELNSKKKIATGNNLKKLLNTFNVESSEVNNENSED